jgi:curved DNA-binding protein
MKDYYEILGVPRDATAEQIRQAYRRLAMRHHPDRGGDDALFKEINQAYSVLADPKQRQLYDHPRAAGFGSGVPPGFSGGQGFGGFRDFEQIFEQMRNQARQTHVRMTLWISLKDVALGGQRTVTIGNTSGVTGARIDIPLAVNDGDHVQYPRLGPGNSDLVVTFRINPEANWRRDRLDLYTHQQVMIWTLIVGGEITVRDILDKEYTVKVLPLTQPGTQMRLPKLGLRTNNNQCGDLYIKLDAVLPTVIEPEILESIQKFHK